MSKVMERLSQYAQLMRLDKPVGIYLLLWPTLWAIWIASEGKPDLLVLFVFVAGVVLMRSAGCVINDFADRKIDGHVKRTADRPIAAGRVSTKEAIILFLLLCIIAFGLVLLMNALTIKLSFVAVLLATSYPFMKRFTHLPQLFLGFAFGWAIPMAFAAIQNAVPMIAWILLLATTIWAVIYDTMYAMVDYEDDLKIGVKSTAILFGEHDRMIIGILQFLMLILLFWVGLIINLDWPFHLSLLIAAVLMLKHRVMIRDRETSECFQAFKQNHWIGLVILSGIIFSYINK
ncbi:MAG: 4-hydroxybenzoate octaprenyltransferase [Gammaproteobacteria bacterium]